MNQQEFEQWIQVHSNAFPGLRGYIAKPENEGVSVAFFNCLADVGLDEAVNATELMNRGDEQSPIGFGDHARTVRRIARERRYKKSELRRASFNQETFKCIDCMDKGWVEVIHPQTVCEIWKEQFRGFIRTSMVVCSCSAGVRKREATRNINASVVKDTVPTYDPDRANRLWTCGGMAIPMIKFDDTKSIAEMAEVVSSWSEDVTKHPNYESAFDSR